ncbi:MAG: tetratricopeptide repeat protein [Nostoc sp.]
MLSYLRVLGSALLRPLRAIHRFVKFFRTYATGTMRSLANSTLKKKFLIKQEYQADGVRHLNQGLDLYNQGLYHDALKQFSQALSYFQRIKDLKNEGTTLSNIGGAYRSIGQYSNALDNYQKALSLHLEVMDRKMEGKTLCGIGAVYSLLGQYSEALQYYNHSLIISREVGLSI